MSIYLGRSYLEQISLKQFFCHFLNNIIRLEGLVDFLEMPPETVILSLRKKMITVGRLMMQTYNLKGKSDELIAVEMIICFRTLNSPLPHSTQWGRLVSYHLTCSQAVDLKFTCGMEVRFPMLGQCWSLLWRHSSRQNKILLFDSDAKL